MAYAVIKQEDPTSLEGICDHWRILKGCEIVEDALKKPGEKKIDPVEVPHVVREFLTAIRVLKFLKTMRTRSEESIEQEKIEEVTRRQLAKCLDIAKKYGLSLRHAYGTSRTFSLKTDMDSEHYSGQPTLANFDKAGTLVRIMRRKAWSVHAEIQKHLDTDEQEESGLAVENAGVAEKAEALIMETYGSEGIARILATARNLFYSNPAVRLAVKSRTHEENARRVRDGAHVLEGPTVTDLLNMMDSKVYGRSARDAMGMALGGPPGLGKTAILTHYIKTRIGVEPVSIDIDPGQSAFTLMAKPKLLESDPIAPILKTLEQLESMDESMIVRIAESGGEKLKNALKITHEDLTGDKTLLKAKLGAGLRRLVEQQMAARLVSTETRGAYEYGPIYAALEKNVPIIINEVQHLRQSDFLHSLLTAIPATDEEAGPEPAYIPTEGQEAAQVKGWFFSTITGRWMRVPDRFRIFFTGNIGQEFGNQGLPPAIVSRLGDRLQEMPMLPVAEQVDIAWAWASDTDGQCVLTPEEAVKLYYLITEVVPEIERLHQMKSIRGQKAYFSIRTIIDIARALNPTGMPKAFTPKVSLEQAIFDQFIQPAITNRYINSLQIVVAVLSAVGFLDESAMKKISAALPQFDSGQLQAILKELQPPEKKGDKKDEKSEGISRFDAQKEVQKNYEKACAVCGIEGCPTHTDMIREHIDDLEFSDELSTIALDKRAVEQILDLQKALAANGQWEYFLEYQMDQAKSGARVMDILTAEQQLSLQQFIKNKIEKEIFASPNPVEDSTPISTPIFPPQKCLDHLQFIRLVRRLGFGTNILNDHAERILKNLQATIDAQFSTLPEGESPTVNSNQLRTLRVMTEAKKMGYEVKCSALIAISKGVLERLEQAKKRVEDIAMEERKGASFAPIFEFIAFTETVHDLYRDQPDVVSSLHDKFLTEEMNTKMFTLFSVAFGMSSDRIDDEDTIGTKGIKRSRKKSKPVQKAPVPEEDTAEALLFRTKLLNAVIAWKNLITDIRKSKKAIRMDQVNQLLLAQKEWVSENIENIVEQRRSASYLDFVSALSRLHGKELEKMLERLVKPKVFEAPPLRVY